MMTDCAAICAAAVQHNAHNLRTPKHEGLYRYGRRCGRHNLLFVLLLLNTTRNDPQHEAICTGTVHELEIMCLHQTLVSRTRCRDLASLVRTTVILLP